jgi:hypothetical protein
LEAYEHEAAGPERTPNKFFEYLKHFRIIYNINLTAIEAYKKVEEYQKQKIKQPERKIPEGQY